MATTNAVPVPETSSKLSLQEVMAQIMSLKSEIAASKSPKPVAVKAKATKTAKPEKPAKPAKLASTGAWHTDALQRTDKEGKPFYTVDLPSAVVSGNVCLVKSNKWGPVLMLINGKRKPIYLRAEHLEALVDAAPAIEAFTVDNAEYLERSMEADDE